MIYYATLYSGLKAQILQFLYQRWSELLSGFKPLCSRLQFGTLLGNFKPCIWWQLCHQIWTSYDKKNKYINKNKKQEGPSIWELRCGMEEHSFKFIFFTDRYLPNPQPWGISLYGSRWNMRKDTEMGVPGLLRGDTCRCKYSRTLLAYGGTLFKKKGSSPISMQELLNALLGVLDEGLCETYEWYLYRHPWNTFKHSARIFSRREKGHIREYLDTVNVCIRTKIWVYVGVSMSTAYRRLSRHWNAWTLVRLHTFTVCVYSGCLDALSHKQMCKVEPLRVPAWRCLGGTFFLVWREWEEEELKGNLSTEGLWDMQDNQASGDSGRYLDPRLLWADS